VTTEYAITNNDIEAAYYASKTLSERAIWSFVTTKKPKFDVTVLNPHVIMGPMIHDVQGPEDISSTNAFPVWNFLNGTYKSIDGLKFPAWYFVSLSNTLVHLENQLVTFSVQVDASDVARAHVLSLTNPRASNKRIILVGGLLTPQLVINIVRKNFPELRDRVIEGTSAKVLPDGVELTGWDTRRSFEVFGEEWEYKGLEETVVGVVRNLLALEKVWTA
jgi:nucleoside-diphosphate-sugar epimerase